MSQSVIEELLAENKATGIKMDTKNDHFSQAIDQMEEKLKDLVQMQSDVKTSTDNNAKQLQEIQSEWSTAMKIGIENKDKKETNVKEPQNGKRTDTGSTGSLNFPKSKTGNKTSASKAPTFKVNKVLTPDANKGKKSSIKDAVKGGDNNTAAKGSVKTEIKEPKKSKYKIKSENPSQGPTPSESKQAVVTPPRKKGRPRKSSSIMNTPETSSTTKSSLKSKNETNTSEIQAPKKKDASSNGKDVNEKSAIDKSSGNAENVKKGRKTNKKPEANSSKSEVVINSSKEAELPKGKRKKNDAQKKVMPTGGSDSTPSSELDNKQDVLKKSSKKTKANDKPNHDEIPSANSLKINSRSVKSHLPAEKAKAATRKKPQVSPFPEGWKKEIKIRKAGKLAGIREVVLKSPTGEKFKDKKKLKKFLDGNQDKVFTLIQSGVNLDVLYDSFKTTDGRNSEENPKKRSNKVKICSEDSATPLVESNVDQMPPKGTDKSKEKEEKSIKKSKKSITTSSDEDSVLYSDNINLPGGWKRAVVLRKDYVRETSIISPCGKTFSSEEQLRKYIDTNPDVITKDTNLEIIFKNFGKPNDISSSQNSMAQKVSRKVIPEKPAKTQKSKAQNLSNEEMVIEAITSLGDKKGSKSKAIKDYISTKYKLENVDFVNKALKNGIANNIFVGQRLFQLAPPKEEESDVVEKVFKQYETVKTQMKEIMKESSNESKDSSMQKKRKNTVVDISNDQKKQKRRKTADDKKQKPKKLNTDDIKEMMETEEVKDSGHPNTMKPVAIPKTAEDQLAELTKTKQRPKKVDGKVSKTKLAGLESSEQTGENKVQKMEKQSKLKNKPDKVQEETSDVKAKKGSGKAKPASITDLAEEQHKTKYEKESNISKTKLVKNTKVSSTQEITGLPVGWKRGEVERKDGTRRVFVCTPDGKKFWQKSRLQKYMDENSHLQIDQSSRSLLYQALRKVKTMERKSASNNIQKIDGLPEGWQSGKVERKDGKGRRVFVCNPNGNKFWVKSKLHKYLEQNSEVKLDESILAILDKAFKPDKTKQTGSSDHEPKKIKQSNMKDNKDDSKISKNHGKNTKTMSSLIQNTNEMVGGPQGWRKGVKDKKDGTGTKVFVCNPSGKKFWLKSQIKKYLKQNPEVQMEEANLKVLYNALKHVSKEKSSQYDMIIAAIKGLGKGKGSKKRAIKCYIAEHFKDKVKNMSFLHKALQSCIDNNRITQKGKLYKLVKESRTISTKRRQKPNLQPKEENQSVENKMEQKEEDPSSAEINQSIDEVITKVTSDVNSQKEGELPTKSLSTKHVKNKVSKDSKATKSSLVEGKENGENITTQPKKKSKGVSKNNDGKASINLEKATEVDNSTTDNNLKSENAEVGDQMKQSIMDFFEYVEQRCPNNQRMGKCKICSKVARSDSLKKHIKNTHKKEIEQASQKIGYSQTLNIINDTLETKV